MLRKNYVAAIKSERGYIPGLLLWRRTFGDFEARGGVYYVIRTVATCRTYEILVQSIEKQDTCIHPAPVSPVLPRGY